MAKGMQLLRGVLKLALENPDMYADVSGQLIAELIQGHIWAHKQIELARKEIGKLKEQIKNLEGEPE